MVRTFTRLSCILAVVFASAFFVTAQLDPTFGTNGKTVRPATGEQTPVESFLLPDGKILVLVRERILSSNDSPYNYAFNRFNSDGTVDASYGTNGSVVLPIPFISLPIHPGDYRINSAVRQPDGKIVAAGWDAGNGLIVRLNEDGTLDTSFSGDGIHRPNINQAGDDGIHQLVLQPDGKIVGVGSSAPSSVFLIRYQANGDLDTPFGGQGGFVTYQLGSDLLFSGLALQSNGSLIALSNKVYRFFPNGILDTSFSPPTLNNVYSTSLLVLSDDRIVFGVSSWFTDALFRLNADINLTRLDADLRIDPTFGNGGNVVVDIVSGMFDDVGDLIELPGGAIAVAARTAVSKNRSPIFGGYMSVLTVGSLGALTGQYLATEVGGWGRSYHLLRQPDGKLIIVGAYGYPDPGDVLVTRHVSVPLERYRFRGIPFEFSSESSGPLGISHPAIFRPSETKWYASPAFVNGVRFGSVGDTLVAGDFFGDYQSELAVFRPSTATWYIAKNYFSATTNFVTIQWGLPGDLPAQYDYDGDGKYDVAVFRPSDGNWYVRRSSDTSAKIDHWGLAGDKPVTGDYDGDGLGDLAVWRPSNGVWYISRSSDGQAYIVPFGLNGDIPVQEDYDGDLKTDIGVFRPSTGYWYILRTSDGSFTVLPFGLSEDIPVPADYDGDRKMDIAVYRPSTSRWYRINSSNGTFDNLPWGLPGDIAVEGRY